MKTHKQTRSVKIDEEIYLKMKRSLDLTGRTITATIRMALENFIAAKK